MSNRSPVFEKTYHTYLSQVENVDLERVQEVLDIKSEEEGVLIPYFEKEHLR